MIGLWFGDEIVDWYLDSFFPASWASRFRFKGSPASADLVPVALLRPRTEQHAFDEQEQGSGRSRRRGRQRRRDRGRLNGDSAVAKFGMAPLGAGVFREGEVSDPEALGAALKELFTEHKLSKTVRLGIANQRVAVRTLRLPLIEDHGELETAIRFQAQDQIPMPLEQAVLDWQVVGHATGGQRRAPHRGRGRRRPARHARGLMEALSRAGLRPVGIDLSAFGMIRALAREPDAAVDAGALRRAPAPATPRRSRGSLRTSADGSAARRRRTRGPERSRRASTATSATSPTWRSPAARPASSPASRPSASRGSPRSSPSGAS